ncbi:MAG: 5'/3'-nucleotidase SurE [Firmicutes bacterium]|nr:5'/3'-nucleotidase SurE [Bacillota bacterium]
MKFLVSNDDGINSEGIIQLATSLRTLGEVVVVAPDMERSATGHAITMHQPLRVRQVKLQDLDILAYAVNGTPADCVKMGIDILIEGKPDYVFTGINMGANLGTDVLYSGTVSAAIEGCIMGVKSVAISLLYNDIMDFTYAGKVAVEVGKILSQNDLKPYNLLNINIPNVSEKEIKGMMVTQLGHRRYAKNYEKREDPRGKAYYWLAGEIIDESFSDDTDIEATKNNYVSVTPLHYNLTSYNMMDTLKQWGFNRV